MPFTTEQAALKATLSRLGATRLVVGHTPQRRANSACGGACWRIDTGMSRWVVAGAVEALEISKEGGVRVLREEQRGGGGGVAPETECDVDSPTACVDVYEPV